MRRTPQQKLNMEDIRGKINAQLGARSLKEREWILLEEARYLKDIQDQKGSIRSINEAVEYIRKIRWSQEIKDEPQQGNDLLSKEEAKAHPDRFFALSLLFYEEARKDAEVIAFRSQVLGNKLLNREIVPEWVQEQSKLDGEPSFWLELAEIPVPRDDAMEILHKGTYIQKGPANLAVKTVKGHFLKYGGPDGWTEVVPTCNGGGLEHLRMLSERLAQEYGWQEAQASIFVLTDSVPIISAIKITHNMERGRRYFRQCIGLDVDITATAQEVAKHYRLKRKEIKAGRTRLLSEKHLRLATFEAERPREETWAQKLEAWNRTQRPEWGYNNRWRFAHDCLQARRRLLGSE